MIKENKVKVKTNNKNISYYKTIDSTIKSGDIILVDISKLSKGSKQIIKVVCDNCGNEKEMMYKTYL